MAYLAGASDITITDDLTVTDAASIAGTLTLGGTVLAATAAEINRAADVSARIVSLPGSTTIAVATHEGKTLTLDGTGSAFTQTLPAATGSGARYRFVVGAVNTSNHVISCSANGADFFGGVLENSTGDTPDLGQPWPTAADNNTITLNGTTTGGAAVGDWIEVQDIATNKYAVTGMLTGSGTEATPFSTV